MPRTRRRYRSRPAETRRVTLLTGPHPTSRVAPSVPDAGTCARPNPCVADIADASKTRAGITHAHINMTPARAGKRGVTRETPRACKKDIWTAGPILLTVFIVSQTRGEGSKSDAPEDQNQIPPRMQQQLWEAIRNDFPLKEKPGPRRSWTQYSRLKI